MEIFKKESNLLCQHCGFEATISYHTFFEKWRRKIKYCPFCGARLTEPVLVENSPLEYDHLLDDRRS